jgi:serine/threonine protein kinase
MSAAQRPTQMRNGRFSVIRPLSKGGMGALYLATENIATGNRKVVIKEMLDYYDSKDPQGQAKARRRFESEAITLANLSIPGVPQVFDYFSEGGRNYIVMQFIEGQNLESGLSHLDENGRSVKGKPYPAGQVRQWGIEVCKMLDNLAAQNVIHMDIKPANLILDKSGAVWLVDFGTAKAPRSKGSGVQNPGKAGLKKSSIFGTIGYAAPEQAAGKPEPRSDVYALAATLYHLGTDDDPGVHPGKFPQMDRLPQDLRLALNRALVLDVRQRVSARELGRQLEPRTTRAIGFHWQDGTVSTDPQDLVGTAETRWGEARTYFSNQSWENWLRDVHRHDLATKIEQIKAQIPDVDLGLDAFLRFLNPKLPQPVLYLPATALDAGIIPWRSQRMLDIGIENRGRGVLQVHLRNLPPGLRSIPDVLTVHSKQTLKLVIDTTGMSPSQRPQVIPLIVDAGPAGRVRLRVRFAIPEPVLLVDPPVLDLGSVYRGQAVDGTFIVHNLGTSPVQCSISSQVRDSGLSDDHFDCLPGSEQIISVLVDTHHYGIGMHTNEIRLHFQAGAWEQEQIIHTQLWISIFQTFWKMAGPGALWALGCGLYGGFLGWFLATLIGGMDGTVQSPIIGGLLGAFLGVVICIFPALALGVLGWLSTSPGRNGLRMGAILGGISGAAVGGVVGGLVGWLQVSAGIFGLLVGGLSAGVLGVLLQRRIKI